MKRIFWIKPSYIYTAIYDFIFGKLRRLLIWISTYNQFGVWALRKPKTAKLSFILSAIIAEAWLIHWLQNGTDLETSYRMIIGVILSAIIGAYLIVVWIAIDKETKSNSSVSPNKLDTNEIAPQLESTRTKRSSEIIKEKSTEDNQLKGFPLAFNNKLKEIESIFSGEKQEIPPQNAKPSIKEDKQ